MGAAVPVVSSGPEAVGDVCATGPLCVAKHFPSTTMPCVAGKLLFPLFLQISKECEGAKGGRVFDF